MQKNKVYFDQEYFQKRVGIWKCYAQFILTKIKKGKNIQKNINYQGESYQNENLRKISFKAKMDFEVDYYLILRMYKGSFVNAKSQSIKQKNPFELSILDLPSMDLLLPLVSSSPVYRLFYHSSLNKNITAFKVSIPKPKLLTNLEIYEWRSSTQFPIVKTFFISMIDRTPKSMQNIQAEVFCQHCPSQLNQMSQIPLSQTLYVLKQSLIGFQRLFNRFGGFQITASMIFINDKGNCRVWISENSASNSFAKNDFNEKKMTEKIINIIQNHCIESKKTKKLFALIKSCSNFLEALKMVQTFITTEKVMVPNRFLFCDFRRNSTNSFLQHNISRRKSFNNLKSPSRKCEKNYDTLLQPKANSSFISLKKNKSFSGWKGQLAGFICKQNENRVKQMKSSEETSSSNHQKEFKCFQDGKQNSENSFICRTNKSKIFLNKNNCQLNEGPQLCLWKTGKNEKQIAQKKSRISPKVSIKETDILFKKMPAYLKKSPSLLKGKYSQKHGNKLMAEKDEEKLENLCEIITQKGWKSNIKQLLNDSIQLKESLHEGESFQKEEPPPKLDKLDALNKRKIAYSILPKDYHDDFL